MARRVLWLELKSVGGPLPVYVVDRIKQNKHGWGYYLPKKHVILIRRCKAVRMMKLALFHEMIHAGYEPWSIDLREHIFGKKYMKRDEHIVGFNEVVIFDLLDRNGLLAIPDPPKLPKKKGTQ